MTFCDCFSRNVPVRSDIPKAPDAFQTQLDEANGNMSPYRIIPPEGQKVTESSEPSRAVDVPTFTPLYLTIDELKIATGGFHEESFIGEGASGRVFKGQLVSGANVAIKMLRTVEISETEFLNMVKLIGSLRHENIVPLLGFCVDGDARMLIYEFAPHGSLFEVLHGWKEPKSFSQKAIPVLHWHQRVKIAMSVARGLLSLHDRNKNNNGVKLAHRALKSSNILLYDDFVAKIGDFNFTKKEVLDPVAPFDPEHDFSRQLIPEKQQEEKSDIYGFGLLLLELLTGRKPVDTSAPRNQQSLVDWAMPRLTADKIKGIVDPRLKGRFPDEGPLKMGMVAALCMDDIDFRPHMSTVIEAIQALVALSQ